MVRSDPPGVLLRCAVVRSAPLAWALALFCVAGCSSTSPTAASSTVSTFHVDVTDPIGDTVRNATYPQLTNLPDLVRATVDVAGGNITFTIRLAPATFDPPTTLLVIDLDTDQNTSTGFSRNGLGVDFSLNLGAPGFGNPPLGNQARILKFGLSPGPFGLSGSVPVTVVADGMIVTVPLSLLGNSDGRMAFRVESLVLLTTISAIPFDDLPDLSLPPARVP
jgi:hypothetical protein